MAKQNINKKGRADFSRYVGKGFISKKCFNINYNKYEECFEVFFMLTQRSPYGGLQYLHCNLGKKSADFWSQRLKAGMFVMVQGSLIYQKRSRKRKRWEVKVMSLDVFDRDVYKADYKERVDAYEKSTEEVEDQIILIDTSEEREW